MRIYEKPIAHRGLHDETRSENSMPAFQLALEAGYNIEIDVHLLKDGKVAIFHDFSLKRMTGKDGSVSDLTSADLEGVKYLLKNGEHIPLFEELLKLVDGKVNILCELKSTSAFRFPLEKAVYELIKDKPWVKIQAFNPFSVLWFKKHAPDIIRGQLATEATSRALKFVYLIGGPFKMLKYTRPDFLAYNILHLPSAKVREAVKKYNMKLLSWTVKTEENVQTAKESGVDNIIFESIRPIKY